MVEYLPFQGKHSIQEAQISLLFLGRFERHDIESTRASTEAELRDLLPISAEVRGGSFQIDITNPSSPSPVGSMSSELVGFRFSQVQGNGQQARVLQLTENVLSASVMDYESWPEARDHVSRCFVSVLRSLPLSRTPVTGFSLRFIDRFTFSGRPGEAKAGSLFVKENPHITAHVFESGPTWHCNTGWFDTTIGAQGDRVLHNLNVSSQPIDLFSAVVIDHNATVHLEAPRQSMAALWGPPIGELALVDTLNILHDQNKKILREILLPEMLSRIGMAP